MKLEAGQVWRRPDGTMWRPHEHYDWEQNAPTIIMVSVDHPSGDEVTVAAPRRVIEETWSQRIDRFHITAALAQIGMNGLTEGATVYHNGITLDDGTYIPPTPLPDEGT